MKDNQLLTLSSLLRKVIAESARQVNTYGIQDRPPVEWLAIIAEEFGELAKAINDYWFKQDSNPLAFVDEVVTEAIQTATLSLKIAEMFQKTIDEYKIHYPPEPGEK